MLATSPATHPATRPPAPVWTETPKLYRRIGGRLKFNFHKYQKRAMRAKQRFVLLLAGTQSGKTSFGPAWLQREIALKGPGDYLAVAPTYKLMTLKMLPEFLELFDKTLALGTLNKQEKVFTFSESGEIALFGRKQSTPTRILFGHATDPDSLESATAKAAWLDECGQKKFKEASFEAIMRRLSLWMGRVLMTTTPYYLGWLKKKFWDAWTKAGSKLNCHSEIAVIRFPSNANPAFPQAEYERARRDLPAWKFKMFYQGIFTRPAGLIYNAFKEAEHIVKARIIPANWRMWYLGSDFGGVNTAALFIVEEMETRNDDTGQLILNDETGEPLQFETGRYIVTNEYHAGGLTAAGHAAAMRAKGAEGWAGNSAEFLPRAFGGAPSEQQWRDEFTAGGLRIERPPVGEVEVGINRVIKAFKTGILRIADTCTGLIDELAAYSRELNDAGDPTEKIENKSAYHLLDALRYIISHLVSDEWLMW